MEDDKREEYEGLGCREAGCTMILGLIIFVLLILIERC